MQFILERIILLHPETAAGAPLAVESAVELQAFGQGCWLQELSLA